MEEPRSSRWVTSELLGAISSGIEEVAEFLRVSDTTVTCLIAPIGQCRSANCEPLKKHCPAVATVALIGLETLSFHAADLPFSLGCLSVSASLSLSQTQQDISQYLQKRSKRHIKMGGQNREGTCDALRQIIQFFCPASTLPCR
jgi:hypothetical protein